MMLIVAALASNVRLFYGIERCDGKRCARNEKLRARGAYPYRNKSSKFIQLQVSSRYFLESFLCNVHLLPRNISFLRATRAIVCLMNRLAIE